jgi:tRNA-modifying protein YgfZ
VQDWTHFLQALTEASDHNKTITTYVMHLNEQGLLAVTGPEAGKFLQGQLTCDTRELEKNHTLLGAQCNLKGRMLLCFRALQAEPEKIILRMHEGLVSQALISLGKYIVFSKAKLLDISQNYRCIGICGFNATTIVSQIFDREINNDNEWTPAGEHKIIRLNKNRYEIWLAITDADKMWQQLASACEIADQQLWALLNIQAGLGDISPITIDKFTPQAINLQLVNGVNFRKGCYTGQEIVARLHYRGALKRHMYRFEFTHTDVDPPLAGTELHNGEGKSVGEIIMAAHKSASHGELLANVLDDQCHDVYITGHPQKLRLLSLPYAITTSNETS